MSAPLQHDFVWTHVPGTTCGGRFICEHLEHWEVRCSYCGECECVLTRDAACYARTRQERAS